MTEKPVRTVGRCIVCGDMIVEVAEVRSGGMGLSMAARILRRCGCGDFEPASQTANANLAERTTDD